MNERISDTFKKMNSHGLQNGNITKFRIVASGVIGLTSIIAGSALLYFGVEVPNLYWYITLGALGGVVGMDLIASVIKGIRS